MENEDYNTTSSNEKRYESRTKIQDNTTTEPKVQTW